MPTGIDLIISGKCPVGANHPMACTFCAFGHMTECHHPLTCSQAECGHYVAQRQLEAFCEIDDLPDPFDDSGEAALCKHDNDPSDCRDCEREFAEETRMHEEMVDAALDPVYLAQEQEYKIDLTISYDLADGGEG